MISFQKTCPVCFKRFGTSKDIAYCSKSCAAKGRNPDMARVGSFRKSAKPAMTPYDFMQWAKEQKLC